MKIEISKEWCRRMAQHEGDAEIGAGRLAVDPVFDSDPGSDEDSRTAGPNATRSKPTAELMPEDGAAVS